MRASPASASVSASTSASMKTSSMSSRRSPNGTPESTPRTANARRCRNQRRRGPIQGARKRANSSSSCGGGVTINAQKRGVFVLARRSARVGVQMLGRSPRRRWGGDSENCAARIRMKRRGAARIDAGGGSGGSGRAPPNGTPGVIVSGPRNTGGFAARLRGRRPRRILILFSATGGGHRASAQAIRSAFEERFGSYRYQVDIVDPITDHSRWPVSTMPPSYNFMVRGSTNHHFTRKLSMWHAPQFHGEQSNKQLTSVPVHPMCAR